MGSIGSLLIVLLFAVTPVILLETLVMPQLTQLQSTYANLDQTAQQTVNN